MTDKQDWLEDVRARHEAAQRDGSLNWDQVHVWSDRAALLAEVDRLREALKERLDDLREVGKAITNGAEDTLWMGDEIHHETVVDFICNITGDDPAFLGNWERPALSKGTSNV